MKCPKCHSELLKTERKGVEVEHCPSCQGVWLDKGELDKIIQRTANYTSGERSGHYPDEQYRQQNHYNDEYYNQKKKKGFLSDFFNFD